MPPVSATPAANFYTIFASVVDTGGNFATGVNDTGGKFATGGKYWQQHQAADTLKGQCHEIFCFWFISLISFPQASDYTIRVVSNFFENSRRYSQLKVCHRCQRHRWQTIRLISGCRYLKVNLKAKIYIYANSTIQRCPN